MPHTTSSNTLAFPSYTDVLGNRDSGRRFSNDVEETSGTSELLDQLGQTIQQRRAPGSSQLQHLTFAQRSPPYDELLKTYASLPSSPVVRENAASPFANVNTPVPAPVQVKKEEIDEPMMMFPTRDDLPRQDTHTPPYSLWDYLREELLATDFDSHQELKWERVGNFLSVPLALEKVRRLKCYESLRTWNNDLFIHSLNS